MHPPIAPNCLFSFRPLYRYRLKSPKTRPFSREEESRTRKSTCQHLTFFFRPILAPDRSWAALDWQSESLQKTDFSAFVQCFTDSAASPLAKMLPMVTPINAEYLLQNDFLKAFETDQVIFTLPASCLQNDQILAQCKNLRSHGKPLALQIDTPETLRKAPLAAFNSIRFDALFARQDFSALDLIYASDAHFRKIATNVDSYEMFGWLAGKGIEWSDSHFLTSPNPEHGKEPDLARLKLLKLLNLVKQDGDTREIEAIFREEAKLSYNLLRLVNSVAVGARTKISSFSQAIAILGRRQLQRWLQLLIYANNLADSNTPNPLMQLAAARGRQMELLSAAIDPIPDIPELSDNAFMAGLFSLLSVLINLPMNEILKEIPLQDEVIDALSNPSDGGVLGRLLSAISAGEAGNFTVAGKILADLGINPAVHAKSQVTAYYWASRINIDNHD